MKTFLAKAILSLTLLGAVAAPTAPLGNGKISVAAFRNNATHELKVVQQGDTLYSDQGKKGGYSKNPTLPGYTWITSFQYDTSYHQKTPAELLAIASSTASSTQPVKVSAEALYVAGELQKFTDDDNISLLKIISKALTPQKVDAAIAFDANSSVSITSGVSSQTYAHTITGANTLLVSVAWVRTSEHTLTDIKYNGVAETAVGQIQGYLNTDTQYMQYLVNPTTGTNNVVQTYGGSGYAGGESLSYTGAAQTGQPDASNSDAGDAVSSSFSLTLTTVVDNTWIVGSWQPADGTCSAGANTVMRDNSSGVIQVGDNGTAQTPAGSHSMNMTGCGNRVNGKIWASFAPALASAAAAVPQPYIMNSDE